MEKGMTATPPYPELLWAGTEHSLSVAVDAHTRVLAGTVFGQQTPEEKELPYMLSIQDNVGVVTIKGSLVNRDSPYNRFFGVSSYADIRRALVAAAEHPDVEGILLDIDSGGGAVSGVADTAALIANIDANFKPVWAFTDGMMASAAYWLGSSARHISSTNTSIVGSIGVITTHMEVSKMLKEAGVGVTVMRAGEYKALANQFEPLTKVAEQQIQDQLNSAYQVFIGHVAEARGTTVNLADQRMGQGREFFGEKALDAGLVDAIQPFDKTFAKFSAILLDNGRMTQNNTGQYHQGPGMTRRALTERQIAAAASGAVDAAAESHAPVVTDETPGTEAAAPATPTDAAAAQSAPAVESSTPSQSNSELVAFLQSQNATLQDQVVSLKVEVTNANAQVASMKGHFNALVAIAGRSLSNMRVALGSPAVDASKMSVETLLADHDAAAESFSKAFKAGGVAAVAQPAESKTPAVLTDSVRKARLAATQVN